MKTIKEFEESLTREDMVTYYMSRTPEEIEQELGPEVSRMIGFEQKNSHHCYDLWEHTLRTVDGISFEDLELTYEQFKKLRVAAFFHDIGKPDVSSFNPKTGQQVFYGHAVKSSEIAKPILEKIGYSPEEIEQIVFFIARHDDFINYKTKLKPYMENSEYIRKITSETLAEKIIENKYDFNAMGYNKDEIRAIVYELAHGKKPDFRNQDGPISIPVDIDEVKNKIASGKYKYSYDASLEDYKMLIELCKADVKAQSLIAKRVVKGKEIIDGSRAEKIGNLEKIDSEINEAYKRSQETDINSLSDYKRIKEQLENENKKALEELKVLESKKGKGSI